MQPEEAARLLKVFLKIYGDEHKTTKKVIGAIPEGNSDYRPDPKARTALELAWHIVSSEVWFLDGVLNGQFGEGESKIPDSIKNAQGLAGWYAENTLPRLDRLKEIPAERLAQTLPFLGMFNEPAVTYLSFMDRHSVHHRGQLSTYLRPMGGKIPSIYGGSADEPFEMPTES